MVAEVGENGRLTIGVPRETVPGERRVALVPDIVKQLVGKANVTLLIESGAGHAASFPDAVYEEAGATIAPNAEALYAQADMIVKVQRPQFDPAAGIDEVAPLRDGTILIAPLQPLSHPDLIRALADKRIVAFSLDAVPRITRAQSMDVLSSQSTVGGYKAVLLAADNLPKFFPMLTTAAGSISPAKVLIIGAGVAGLQAIATARRLGSVVEAYDTRPVVKEQVESLGAKFVDVGVDTSDTQTAGGYAKEVSADVLRRQQEVLADHAAGSDVVITTALVPGRPAPRLVSAETVGRMRQGSVIVDLAAETGGNCELTVPGEVVQRDGVTIIGLLNLPSLVPVHASQMFAHNIQNLLKLLIDNEGQFAPDYNDEVVSGPEGKGALITRDGDIVHAPTRDRFGLVAVAAG